MGAILDLSSRLYGRAPIEWSDDPAGPILTFSPPLSADELAKFPAVLQAVAFGLGGVDVATLTRLWPQIQACGTFATDPNPTPAEAFAALNALILIVRSMLAAGAPA